MQPSEKNLAKKLLQWYERYGRKDLPWRRNVHPYRVWLSEIMLQQTQVATVIPYYEKFLKKFPNIKKLAAAHEDEVLHLWSGLGYYSRARNLHKTAKIIVHKFAGEFPQTIEALMTLPGIGRSTAGAIAAISYNIPAPILDGNVKRVLTRFMAIEGWPGNSLIENKLWDLAGQFTPLQQVSDYTQAIMDLGAIICTRTQPKCLLCPLQKDCLAFKRNLQNSLPMPKPKKSLPEKSVVMLIIKNDQQQILLQKRPPIGIWGGLWSLPECAFDADITQYCLKEFGFVTKFEEILPELKHTFSHFLLKIKPAIVKMEKLNFCVQEKRNYRWVDVNNIELGIPTPVRKIFQDFARNTAID